MHASVMDWGKIAVGALDLSGKSVLEVGSTNVNGSLRTLFDGPYLGVDIRPGPGVDQCANGNFLPFATDSYDVVVCTETLSHDPCPWMTMTEMWRVLKEGGYLLLSVRGIGFGRNDSPCDYYRFTREAIEALLHYSGYKEWDIQDDPQYSGVMAWSRK